MNVIQQVTHVYILGQKRLGFRFADGFESTLDLKDSDFDAGSMVKPLADESFFQKVYVPDGYPTIQWPNDYDISPDTIRRWCEEGRIKTE